MDNKKKVAEEKEIGRMDVIRGGYVPYLMLTASDPLHIRMMATLHREFPGELAGPMREFEMFDEAHR